MKKQLLLFAFSALALTSCEDDDIQGYEMDMMKGEWKTVKKEVISGKDDKTLVGTEVITGCDTKNITLFRTDYFVSYTTYSGVGSDCQLAGTVEGKYTYDTENKNMEIRFDNAPPMKYEVVILTATELRIKQLNDNVDQNGDQIIDFTYTTYKR
ncbi:lipocalin family protein [Chryseobacterium fluminis]|uniref:lipocalin family protein n=1 Tax=Chryseobacterium fluminis TaxID=2983606 RepID=UPI00225AEE80|nr:lipocalin family protein [Chryseobacterium sp. MMS21-Ot14]UZT97822.1 lipocalin family protein [Chryseobacterium sp. MMS21-Ot14]